MLFYLILALHIVVSVVLIGVVLLQSGKGADLAGAFGGGGSQTAFGSRGAATFLSKMTTICAVLFMVTSLALAILYNRQSSSVVGRVPYTTTPAKATTPAGTNPVPAPAQKPPSPQK